LSVAPKKGPKKYRLVHNVRHVNKFCKPHPFRYESLKDLQAHVHGGEWMVKFDLTAGYHHIPLHESQSKYFGFEFEGNYFCWRQLFFGLTLAPYFFTMVLRAICKKWRFRGIVLVHYLDDILVVAPTREQAVAWAALVKADLESLGFVISEDKSQLTPSQVMEFLGFVVDTTGTPSFRVPPERALKLTRALRAVLRLPRTAYVPVRTLASIAGQIMSMSLALAPARLYTRDLYAVINSKVRHELPGGWRASVAVSEAAWAELEFWLTGLGRWNGSPINRESTAYLIEMFSDASTLHGWGGWCFDPEVVREWPLVVDRTRVLDAQGRWLWLERHDHINLQELRGFLYVLQSFARKLPAGIRIRPRLDNTVAIAYINNGGGPIAALTAIVRQIWLLAVEHGWLLEPAEHIPGHLNCRADFNSRVFDSSDWKLNPILFGWLDAWWGTHTYDRCASRVNRQNNLPFDSRYYDPEATGVDTMLQSWRGHNNYCNPDFAIIDRILQLLREQGACCTLVVPRWPRTWWATLVNECVDWVELPRWHSTFLAGSGHSVSGRGIPPWRIFAFRLDYRQGRPEWLGHVQRSAVRVTPN